MSQIILCITDRPAKFSELRKQAFAREIVLVTSCRLYHILEYLKGPEEIIGIALDFEMPFGTGVMFARIFQEHNVSIPTVITESNKHDAKKIKEVFQETGFEFYTLISSKEDNWEQRAINFWIPNLTPEVLKLSELIFDSSSDEDIC